MILWRKKKFLFSTHRFGISLYNNTLVQSICISKSFSGKKNLLTTNLRNVEANNVEHFCHQWACDVPVGRILKTIAIFSRFDIDEMMMQLYIVICYVTTFKFPLRWLIDNDHLRVNCVWGCCQRGRSIYLWKKDLIFSKIFHKVLRRWDFIHDL